MNIHCRFALLTVVISFPVYSENLLEEIVVTATRSEKLLQNSPYAISVLTKQKLALQPVDQLAELLRDQPGVQISDAGQAGQLRMRIRGEEARRIAMLIDGQEYGDHREVGVPLLIDPGEIERIELVRGPASVLYGSRALAGVVNIITRTPEEEPFSAFLSAALDSATNGLRITTSLGGVNQYLNWRLGYSTNKQNDRETPVGKIENTSYESDSISFSVSKNLARSEFRMRYEDFNSASRVFVEPAVRFQPPFVDFALDVPQRDRKKISAFYKLMPRASYFDSVQLDIYQQVSDRKFNSFPSLSLAPGSRQDTAILTTSRLTSDGANLQLNFAPGYGQKLVTGMQFVEDRIHQFRRREVSLNDIPQSSETNFDKASLTTLAAYLQDDITLSEHWFFLAGMRYYRVAGELDQSDRFAQALPRFSDSELVKSVALTYSPDESLTWRMNYSDGYIYPSLLNLVMGAFAGPRYINPTATLKPETSKTVEIGVRLNHARFSVDAGFFAMKANDYIDHLFCVAEDECLGARDKVYRNVGQARSHGLELMASIGLGESSIYSNLTWLRRRKEYAGIASYKSGIPLISGILGWRTSVPFRDSPIELDVFARFASSADEKSLSGRSIVEETNPGWGTLNLSISFVARNRFKMALQLVNLMDKKYASSTENLLSPGRSARVLFSAEL